VLSLLSSSSSTTTMTLKDTLVKVAGKVDKVVSGFDDSKEKK
jgi:hypothetical protein